MVGSVNRRVMGASFPWFSSLHVIGGAIGGASAAVVLRWYGSMIGAVPATTLVHVFAGLSLLGIVLRQLGLVRFRTPSVALQVPADWRYSLPKMIWVPGFGLLLGIGILTRIASGVVLVGLLLLPLLAPTFDVAVVGGAAFGIARTSYVLFGSAELRKPPIQVERGALIAIGATTLASTFFL